MEAAPAIDGDALRQAREHAGMTQHELARHVGVAGGERVSLWERGVARPRSPRILHTVAQALGVEAASLLIPPPDGPDLRWLRFVAGLSISEAAAASHTSVPALKRWEAQGARAPSSSTIEALAAALGVSPQEVRAALRRP